jgi:cytochrome c oxidase subunit 2
MLAVGSLLASMLAGCAFSGADAPMSTVQPASEHARYIQSLYKIVFWLAAIVFIGTMIASLWFTLGFRDNGRRQARQFHGNARLEVLWTIIPVVIVIIIAIPTFDRIFAIAEDPPADALKVEVIGHQWWFEFRYPELGITTANEIHIPAGRAATFTLNSDDVIHSFWVPQLFGKVDVVPGHENHVWFTPDGPRVDPKTGEAIPYLGQCMELCGLSHANMRFRVFVDTPAAFDTWAKRKRRRGTRRPAPRRQAKRPSEQACVGLPRSRARRPIGQT